MPTNWVGGVLLGESCWGRRVLGERGDGGGGGRGVEEKIVFGSQGASRQ